MRDSAASGGVESMRPSLRIHTIAEPLVGGMRPKGLTEGEEIHSLEPVSKHLGLQTELGAGESQGPPECRQLLQR